MVDSVSPSSIRELCQRLCPELIAILSHNSSVSASSWEAELRTGKAVEILSLCALALAFKLNGGRLIVPRAIGSTPELFFLRNVVPRHHNALAGHRDAHAGSVPLSQRFLAALTPKFAVDIEGSTLSVFREGSPIHQILYATRQGSYYLDRPDLVVIDGNLEATVVDDVFVDFSFSGSSLECSGRFRVRNDAVFPLVYLRTEGAADRHALALVECSVGKSVTMATAQLRNYRALFAGENPLISMLVSGKKTNGHAFDFSAEIDLDGSISSVEATLNRSFDKLAKSIVSLISRR